MFKELSFRRIVNIAVFFISIWFIVLGFLKFFVSRSFSFSQFIVIEIFFIVCGVASLVFICGKASSLNDITKGKPNQVGDYLIYILGFIFGVIGLFVSVYWMREGMSRIVSIIGSTFFVLGSILVILLQLKGINRK